MGEYLDGAHLSRGDWHDRGLACDDPECDRCYGGPDPDDVRFGSVGAYPNNWEFTAGPER